MSDIADVEQKIEVNDDFIINQGRTLYRSSKTGHDLILSRMKLDMDLYDGIFSDRERKYSEYLGADRLFIPKTYTNIHRIAIDVIEAFIQDPEEIVDIRTYKSLPDEIVSVVKALINYRLNNHPIDFYKELYEGTIDAIRNMYCVFKVYPKLKTKKVMVPETKQVQLPNGETIEMVTEREEEQIIAYEPALDCLPPEDVLFSSRATWKDYYKFPIIHTYWETRDVLKRTGFKNVDAVPGAKDANGNDVLKYQRNFKTGSVFMDETNVKAQEQVRVFQVWDFLPYKDEGLVSCSYSLLGDASGPSVVGRSWEVNELPYRVSEFESNRPPFTLGLAYPEPHKLPGKSYPQITESLQKETNAQRNQEREAVARDLRKTLIVNREANVDLPSLLQRRIGAYTMADGPANQAVSEVSSSHSAAIGNGAQARTDQDYYETGLPPNLLGSSNGESTATGQTQQLANANKKIAFVLKNIAYSGILPALQMVLRLDQTYCSDEFINMVTGRTLGWRVGDDEYPAKEVIQGDFDLLVNIGLNKQAQVNKDLLILDRMNQYNAGLAQLVQLGVVKMEGPDAAKFANPVKIFENLLRINGHKKVEEHFSAALPPSAPVGDVPGVASQTGNVPDAGSSVSQLSPASPDVLSNG